jgi:acetyl-CoA hydrolase
VPAPVAYNASPRQASSADVSILDSILDGSLRIDGILLQGRALDERHATTGLIADIMRPAWDRARFRALELNDALPRIASEPLRIDTADYIVHRNAAPIELRPDPISDLAIAIAAHIAEIVPDGATIELGVGRALAAVADALARGRRDLAMHTGIVGNAAMQLILAGCVCRPIRGSAVAVGATAMGTREFYAWADENERSRSGSRCAHRPEVLAATPAFCAINSALQVDLGGNVNSMVYRGKVVGGVGGGADFAEGGARGEASVIALFSTTRDGASTIVPQAEAVSIPGGTSRTWSRNTVSPGFGARGSDRARAMVALAAPSTANRSRPRSMCLAHARDAAYHGPRSPRLHVRILSRRMP